MIIPIASTKSTTTVALTRVGEGGCIRHGLRHGPASMNPTGFPPRAAASTRSGRPLSGHVPVHAARASAPASQFQSGSDG